MIKKRAVSPIIATVLLIMIVIILAIIILLWSRGFIKEAITKEIGGEKKTVEQYCREASVNSFINEDGSFGFKNTGNIPFYKFKLRLTEKDSGNTFSEEGGSVNPSFAVSPIKKSDGSDFVYQDYEEIKIVPILLGKKKSGVVEPFECPEGFSV